MRKSEKRFQTKKTSSQLKKMAASLMVRTYMDITGEAKSNPQIIRYTRFSCLDCFIQLYLFIYSESVGLVESYLMKILVQRYAIYSDAQKIFCETADSFSQTCRGPVGNLFYQESLFQIVLEHFLIYVSDGQIGVFVHDDAVLVHLLYFVEIDDV